MESLRKLRRAKRIKETMISRLIAVLVLVVFIIVLEVTAFLTVRSGAMMAYAGETGDEDVIIIPVDAGESTSGDEVPGNESKEKKEEKQEEPAVPNVKITITEPSGWHRKEATVKISAEDTENSGDFVIKSVKGKIGQGGSWTDITDTMSLELSENCTVYVEITDTKDRVYTKNKRITCFDLSKPTLNAAVNNGTLTVDTSDNDSGVRAVYVNGFEFTDLGEGTLVIRMQQFDTGYESFVIQAVDYAGNMSDTYRVNNPYYKRKDGTGKENKVLPESAEATKPASATGTVTDHIKTDGEGNTLVDLFSNALSSVGSVSSDSKSDEKKKALVEADRYEAAEAEIVPGKGREFYTIEAKSGKVFYLIIDRDGDDETVHFVTDITENDLLNVTEERSGTLPRNAADVDNGEMVMESALPNNNLQTEVPEESGIADLFGKQETEITEEAVSVDETSANEAAADESTEEDTGRKALIFRMILFAIAGLIAAFIYGLKKMRRERDGNFLEEEDDSEEGDYPDDEEPESTEDDGFYDESEKSDETEGDDTEVREEET